MRDVTYPGGSVLHSIRHDARETAKLCVRGALSRANLDLVHDPFVQRVSRGLRHLGIETVVDVGANIGQYAAALRRTGFTGRIVSCEPLPQAFARLRRRSGADVRWDVVNSAVGERPGNLRINVAANSYSSSLLPITRLHTSAAPGSHTVAALEVPVTTVLELVAIHGIEPGTSLLKIDTQGYEAQVLTGAGELLHQFAAVQLELSLAMLYDGQASASALVSRLEEAGFVLFGLDPGLCDRRTGRLLQMDALFVSRRYGGGQSCSGALFSADGFGAREFETVGKSDA